jgi:hypothetical protein
MICTRNGMTLSSTEPKTSTCVIGNTAPPGATRCQWLAERRAPTTAAAAQVVPLVQSPPT